MSPAQPSPFYDDVEAIKKAEQKREEIEKRLKPKTRNTTGR